MVLEVRSPLSVFIKGFVQQNGFNVGVRVCLTELSAYPGLFYSICGKKIRDSS